MLTYAAELITRADVYLGYLTMAQLTIISKTDDQAPKQATVFDDLEDALSFANMQ